MVKNPFKATKKRKIENESHSLVALADRHNKLKEWELAAQYYREALKVDGNRASIWVQLGHMEKEKGQVSETLHAYQMAISLNPLDTDARVHLAHFLKKQGDNIGAYNQFKSVYSQTGAPEVEAELRRIIGTTKPYKDFLAAVDENFNEQFYLANNPDIAESGIDPKQHYILYGWKERRQAAASNFRASGNPFHENRDERDSKSWVALSVVIPTFNRALRMENTLRKLLDIVKDDPVEIFVVDDGSSDSTPDVLANLAFHHAKLRYKSVENAGPGRARNIGAAETRGEIILFLGDDTTPVNSDLLRAHYQAHLVNKDIGHAVLGKIIWPDQKSEIPNAVMSLVQGDGQQQFGFKFMKPWQKYPPWLFYTANVSVKRHIVSDWSCEGFDCDFTLYGFEDSEFAYRMSKKHENFGVYYTPNAIVEHHHHYNTAGFIRRQVACGMMIEVLIKKHPELEALVLGEELCAILKADYQADQASTPTHHYSTMIEGIRAWALVIDHHYGLGSQNWHSDFLSAVFRISLLDSYIMLRRENPTAQAAAYRFLLTDFRMHIGRAISNELLGDLTFANLV